MVEHWKCYFDIRFLINSKYFLELKLRVYQLEILSFSTLFIFT